MSNSEECITCISSHYIFCNMKYCGNINKMAGWPWMFWRKKLNSGQKAFLKFGLPMVVCHSFALYVNYFEV